MIKVILYGIGKVFSSIENDIWMKYNVVAICDKKYLNNPHNNLYNNVPIISPMDIRDMDYDLLVICTRKYYESIKTDLIGNFYVDKDKIVSYRIIFSKCYIFEKNTIKFFKAKLNHYSRIDNPDSLMLLNILGTYNKKNMHSVSISNLLLLWGRATESIKKMDYLSKDIIWMIPYCYVRNMEIIEIVKKLKKCYKIKKYNFFEGLVIECVREKDNAIIDGKIYVVSHKKYNIINNAIYQPMMVGNLNEKDKNKLNNINQLNPILNECTALYWIWKNTKSEIVGLNHYRRLFCNDDFISYDNILNAERINNIICKYDIILQKPTFLMISLYDNISSAVGEELTHRGFEIVKHLISQKQPEYYEDFLMIMNGNVLYACNMFVTHRCIMEEYCEWLFSFIIDAANSLDVSNCSTVQKRTIGYFAEVMLSVWIFHRKLNVYSLPSILL